MRLTIPNNVGVISAFNTLVLNNIQGVPKVDSSSSIVYVGGGGTSVKWWFYHISQNVSDGLHFRVRHQIMVCTLRRSSSTLSGIESDVKPEKLTSSVDSASTDDMTVTAVGIFTSFENVEVNSSNPELY